MESVIPSLWMEDILRFGEARRAGWTASLAGASAAQIRELEKLAGHVLPGSYRRFLEMMGMADGGLRLADAGTTSVKRLIDDYRQLREDDDVASFVPPGCILIGTGDPSAGDLLLQAGEDGAEPRVVRSVDGEIYYRQADSLPQFIFYKAFMNFEFGPMMHRVAYRASGDDSGLLAKAAGELEALGFGALWFSDSCRLGAQKGDTAVVVSILPRPPALVQVASRSSVAEAERVGSMLARTLGLTPYGTP